jgi:hypothetical protein
MLRLRSLEVSIKRSALASVESPSRLARNLGETEQNMRTGDRLLSALPLPVPGTAVSATASASRLIWG